MKKPYKLVSSTDDTITYCWNGSVGKGLTFIIFRGEFNYWYAAQLEGGERIELGDGFWHVIKVAELLGLVT